MLAFIMYSEFIEPMKKILLSTFIILSFGVYVVFQNKNTTNDLAIIPTVLPVDTTNSKSKEIFDLLINETTVQEETPVQTTPKTTPTVPKPNPTPVVTPTLPKGQYVDGTYTGDNVDAYYGYVQVKAVISGGKITDVVFLDYPHDRNTSKQINAYAIPRLTQQAISAQNANVNGVSGASFTSSGFKESLTSALIKAKV